MTTRRGPAVPIGVWLAAAWALSVPPAASQPAPPRVLAFMEALTGTEEEELHWPVAIAAASAEEIAVADAFEPRLLRFRKVGVSWQLARAVAMPAAPADLVWDGGRYVASLRGGRGLVAFEGPDLTRRALPLPRGAVPGALAAPGGGELLVVDHAGGRVLRMDAEGELIREIPVEGHVTALAASASGGVFAAVATEGAVLRFGADGALDATWRLPPFEEIPAWPVGLAVEPGGDVVVVDRHAGRLLVLDANGDPSGVGARRGWEPGLLRQPAAIARLPDGLLAVADAGNGRAQLFRPLGSGPEP